MSLSNDPEPVEGKTKIFKPNRLAFIPYLMAGDPDLETTGALISALRGFADAIELGIPYGDPLADGPTIAAAGVRALASGVTISDVLQLVREAHANGAPPVVLFTYYNPVYQYGIERFAKDAAQAGAWGVIVPDIALEEGDALREALARNGLQMPLLVAPSTPPERAAKIAEAATGFIYVVSRLGVTGAGEAPDFTPLREQIAMLRAVTDKPLAVGFGLSRPEHVGQIRGMVDAAIVGSAIIDAYAGSRSQEAARRVGEYVRTLRLPS